MTYFSKMPIDELIAEVSEYSQDWLAALDARDDDMMKAIESSALEALPRLLDEVERLRKEHGEMLAQYTEMLGTP